MPERSALFETVQIGVESTPGTPVAANKKLLATSFEVAPNPDVSLFRPQGYKWNTIASLNREWVEGNISGVMSYTDLTYLFSSLITTDTPAVTGTTGQQWDFVSDSDGPDTPKTFTIEQGSSVRAHRWAHCLINALTLTINNDGCEVDGSFIGTALEDGVTLTASPTEVALQPVMRTEVGIKWADTAAGLSGASFLTRPLSVEWSLSDRYAPVWVLNQSTSWPAFVESEPSGELKIMLEADSAGMALLTNMRAGSSKFVRIQATGPQIGAGPATYSLIIDTCIKVTSIESISDEDDIIAVEWAGEFAHDSTWTKAFNVSLINALSSL